MLMDLMLQLLIALVVLIGSSGFVLLVLIGALRMNKTGYLDCPHCRETFEVRYTLEIETDKAI